MGGHESHHFLACVWLNCRDVCYLGSHWLMSGFAVKQGSNVFAGKHGFITPRDLFRWAGRGAVGYQQVTALVALGPHGHTSTEWTPQNLLTRPREVLANPAQCVYNSFRNHLQRVRKWEPSQTSTFEDCKQAAYRVVIACCETCGPLRLGGAD